MLINQTHPDAADPLCIVRTMAGVLQRMHTEQHSHGGIQLGRWGEWLTDCGTALDENRFRNAAALKNPASAEAFAADVYDFAALCVDLIRGKEGAADKPFCAEFYRGRDWPVPFLDYLEAVMIAGQTCSLTMQEMSDALQEPAPGTNHDLTDVNLNSEGEPAKDIASFGMAREPCVPSPPDDGSRYVAGLSPANSFATAPAIRIALRNATVGKPYYYEAGKIAAAIAAQFKHDPAQASISHFQLPENCGLVFDPITGSLSGVPTRPFEGELSLDYVAHRSARSVPAQVSLLINPDPASLWKDLPPPAGAPYQKPLQDHRETQHGPFRVVAASRRGRSHANKGEFRDDDFAIGFAPETGWLVIVVADGAGSAAYSRRGSQIASTSACDRLTALLNSSQDNHFQAHYLQHQDWQHPLVRHALRQSFYEAALVAHHKLRDEVRAPSEVVSPPPALRNYDTTLILLALKREGNGCVAATFSIGDGGAGLLPTGMEGIPLTVADSGEHAGQTVFLTFDSTLAYTEENLTKRFNFVQTSAFTGALAMTDGITDPKFPSDAAFADPAQWAGLWSELQAALTSSQALLEWLNFPSPGNHDDRTLVAVLPAPAAGSATP